MVNYLLITNSGHNWLVNTLELLSIFFSVTFAYLITFFGIFGISKNHYGTVSSYPTPTPAHVVLSLRGWSEAFTSDNQGPLRGFREPNLQMSTQIGYNHQLFLERIE